MSKGDKEFKKFIKNMNHPLFPIRHTLNKMQPEDSIEVVIFVKMPDTSKPSQVSPYNQNVNNRILRRIIAEAEKTSIKVLNRLSELGAAFERDYFAEHGIINVKLTVADLKIVAEMDEISRVILRK